MDGNSFPLRLQSQKQNGIKTGQALYQGLQESSERQREERKESYLRIEEEGTICCKERAWILASNAENCRT